MKKSKDTSHVTSRFRAVSERIQQLIAHRRILPGDRLPAERKLADALGTGRTSVREALRILEQKGLIEIRLGRNGGAYVTCPSSAPLSEGMKLLLRLDRLSLDQIAAFREAIECGIVEAAAGKADADDIRQLNHRLARARTMIGSGDGGIDEFLAADQAIHLRFAQIAGNPLFEEALTAALGLKRYFVRFRELPPAFMDSNLDDLQDIVRAMENRQPLLASLKVRNHIVKFNTWVG